MTGPRAPRPPLRTLRLALLAAAVLVVVAVAGLYVLGRRAQPGLAAPPEREEPTAVDRGAGAIGQGFEYEQRIGERSAFRLEGDEFQRGLDEVVTLRGVVLELTREDGKTYRIESRDAIWDPGVREARLSGDVRLAQGEFRLSSQRLDLVDGGRTVLSKGPVQLGFGRGIEGRATGMRYDAAADRFQLKGRVRIAGTAEAGGPELALEAGSVNYDRGVRLLRAVGNVALAHGADLLDARAVDLILDPAERSPRKAIARGEVSGRIVPEGAEASTPVRFEGTRLELEFAGDPARANGLELRGDQSRPARIQFPGEGGAHRLLVATAVTAELAGGRPTRAVAEGGVLLREGDRLASGKLRRDVLAQTATAIFGASGEIEKVDLRGAVEVRGPDFEASGATGEVLAASDLAILRGEPRALATARTPRGVFQAPEIRYARGPGIVRGVGGVLAEIASGEGGLSLGSGDGTSGQPVRVEAREADWHERDGSWSFQGRVQAVQGEDLLFAERLQGSEPAGTVAATGGVRTVWRPASGDGTRSEPMTIAAERVDYDRAGGEIVYTGSVTARQLERELAADSVTIELDAEQRARRMVATGGVRIVDRSQGRTVQGAEAVHDLAAETILVTGEPVILAEREGTSVRGRRLLYDLVAGTARMLAEGEGAS